VSGQEKLPCPFKDVGKDYLSSESSVDRDSQKGDEEEDNEDINVFKNSNWETLTGYKYAGPRMEESENQLFFKNLVYTTYNLSHLIFKYELEHLKQVPLQIMMLNYSFNGNTVIHEKARKVEELDRILNY
jgi:hypothetical protein